MSKNARVEISEELASACLAAMRRDLKALESSDEANGIVSIGDLGIRKMWISALEEAISK